ncbi:family 43 glycosylhydrolase [Mangrovibacterium lignilyticum]|uniref:family 43 glycosylhydrolase n=1 Tax=Mangrovibacterium lignilyticum TaxID=2668052 RepID=UPI0013D5873F|nr:family 43 glycosylhydrolase [Mangrovibacterium lignilyticum]
MRYIISLCFLLFIGIEANAQNPIVPPGVYIADPSARVWNDGKLYVYGSLDESTTYYCSYMYHVLSTSDMKNWELTPDVFNSRGDNDQISYSDKELYAPDCTHRNGLYYLYYCQPDRKAAEGVAVSDSPTGPFVDGKKINLNGIEQIDPAVFIDDDGQAYYIWGQFEAKIAKLKDNMMEIDTSTIVENVLTEKEHHFHEGSFMFKRNGIYYMVYADMSRGNRPTCIGYSMSNSPMGPFKYGGVIVDNDHCDPATWNNHGSVVQFRGRWYVFYHRSTHNSRMMRKACVEPIEFNADGSINEVEMTSQGAGAPLSAFEQIDSERACLLYGNVRIQLFEPGNEKLTEIHNTDNVAYKYVDFQDGANEITVKVKPLKNGGTVIVRADEPWGPIIGMVRVPGEKDGEWQMITSKMKGTSGVHAIWLGFYGADTQLMELDWFEFSKR